MAITKINADAMDLTDAYAFTGTVTGTGQTAKAWVNFNGTGTVAIRASYNVSSITDNGTGNYDINFTTAMANTSYAVVASTAYNIPVSGNRDVNCHVVAEATTHANLNLWSDDSNVQIDFAYIQSISFGD